MRTTYKSHPLIYLVLVTSSLMTPAHAEKTNTATNNNSFEVYPTPSIPQPTAEDRAKDCTALEQEIAHLVPKTYSYKPDFYSDPYQGVSISIGTTVFMPAYLISAYSGLVDYREKSRIIPARNRIEALRQAKAEQHCFEN